MGLDKCIMTCIHYDSIIQSIFTAPKILCASPVRLSQHLKPCQPLSFFFFFFAVAIVYLFQSVIYLELYSIYPFHIGFIHLAIHLFLQVFSVA